VISTSDFVYFADRALGGMIDIVTEMGDERANARPDLPGANSPFALLTHCLGVIDAWAGGFIHGRTISRDRLAEFEASGPVSDLVARAANVRIQFHLDVKTAQPDAPLVTMPPSDLLGPPRELTQGAALQHVYEELAQHHGQMQVIRDVMNHAATRSVDTLVTEETDPFAEIDIERLRQVGGAKWQSVDADVIPAWVADMDFGVPPVVKSAIAAALENDLFGYPSRMQADSVLEAFERRMAERFGWEPSPQRTRVFTDLLQVIQVVTELATKPGDGVGIHVPCYPPFLEGLERSGRRIVPLPMIDSEDGWVFDVGNLATSMRSNGVRMLVVVNPQNPTGRVFNRTELGALAACAEELDLVVMSDEIHADLTLDGHQHIPFASISPDAAGRTITTTSATKAFNLAGVRCAVAHFGPSKVWESLGAFPYDILGAPSTMSRLATVAAWTHGDAWRHELLETIAANHRMVHEWVSGSNRNLRHHAAQATYLAWVDFAATPISHDPTTEILTRGRVLLSAGADFSRHTEVDASAFARINLATSSDNLTEILSRIDNVLR
jgi:bifunctional pyridoxal-dependent enzyme with beta-cystathionase and maltose regulon repressor activities